MSARATTSGPRKRLAELGGMDELNDEQRSEIGKLRTEYQDIETRSQALTIAGDDKAGNGDDGQGHETRSEDRDMADLERRADLGNLMHGLFNPGAVPGDDGPMKELQQHYHLGENQIPVQLLRRSEHDNLETRAVTPAPSDVGAQQQTIIPYVFPRSVAGFLGVDMPTVGVGEQVYPVLTSALTVTAAAENADANETTGSFSADVLTPSRLQASFFYSREDRAKFAGMDAALRMNLSEGLADGLDKQVLVGSYGLLSADEGGGGSPTLAANASTAEADFPNFMSTLAYGRVDGRYAATTGDVRIVMGAPTYAKAGATYRNNSVDRTALDRLMEVTGGVRVSAHIPAVASKKQNALVRLGMLRDMVAPVWEGVTLIPDEVTKAKSGQIVVTAVMLYAVRVLRTDPFRKQEFQVAA